MIARMLSCLTLIRSGAQALARPADRVALLTLLGGKVVHAARLFESAAR